MGKHLCWGAGLQTCTFVKKSLQQRCFPVNIAKFLGRTYFKERLREAASEHRGIKEKTTVFPQLVFSTRESYNTSVTELVSKYYIWTIYSSKSFKSLKSC